MPVYRITVFFGQANTGWSETLWKTAGSLTELAPQLSQYLDFRNTILTDIHNILGVRVAIEGDSRKGRVFLPGSSDVGNQTFLVVPATGDYELKAGQEPWDQVRACLQCEVIKDGRRLSLRYLAGIPDITSQTEPATVNRTKPAAWWQHFRNYSNLLLSGGWQIKMLDRTNGNPEQPARRYVLQQAGPALLGVQIALAPGLAVGVGDKVSLRGVKMRADGIQSPNGKWKVESSSQDNVLNLQTIYLRLSEGFAIGDIKELGFIRKVLPTFSAIDALNPYRVGVHKRGKPFGSPRGRSKTRTFA